MGYNIIVDDEPSELSELENEIGDEQEAEETIQPEGKEEQAEEDEGSLLPERFKGKSRSDIAKSYSELEKLLGRQSTELGELRKLAEQHVNKILSDTERQSSVDPEDLWSDPNGAIDKRVDSKVKRFEEKLSEIEQSAARREIKRLHPDIEQIVPDQEFQRWVLDSPTRTEQFRQANEGFSIDSANDLMTEWKSQQAVKSEATKAKSASDKAKRDKDLKAAATETSSTGQSSKKIYRRSDLQRLRTQDPDKFDAMQAEIIKAYAEGRVR